MCDSTRIAAFEALLENKDMTKPGTPRGQLCIWTSVDQAFEADFNRWYDREHMQERVAIPGFQSARRFRALDEGPRPWLALYDTDNLEVFRSEAYRQAFANQTEWSLRNFERMRDTQRRVGELEIELGDGEGGALALFVAPPGATKPGNLRSALQNAAEQDDVVRAAVLRTDAQLSTPVGAGSKPVPADLLVSVEATEPQAATAQARSVAEALGLGNVQVQGFRLLWRIGANFAAQ
jgi:hypothetical protein